LGISLLSSQNENPSGPRLVEICVKGKWLSFPTLEACGQTIVIKGKLIKIAALDDEQFAENEVVNPDGCIERVREQRHIARADIFSFAQKLPSITPRYQYPMELESIAVAQTGSFTEWWEGLPQESRKNVRRSQKRGVTIGLHAFDDELIRGISDVQNESPFRQGRKYPHYGKSFEQVKRLHSGIIDRSDFICAYFEGRIIGFLKLVYRGGIASILQLNSMLAHYDKRPSNALLAEAVKLCEAKSIGQLTYGRFNYGNKRDSSLRQFKTRNGFKELLVPRYYVPLNSWGRLCVSAKLYRGLFDILPPEVIAALLTARDKWNARRVAK